MGAKVLVIGLDGATPELLERWTAEGKLPHLGGMIAQGVYGTLRSTYPPISPAAWTSFATGMNPGKHGTYDFRDYDPRRYGCFADTIVDSRPMIGRTIWDRVGASGRKVGVVTVPVTYPAWRVNGFMVSGYPTPDAAKSFTYPPDLGGRIPPLTEDSSFFKSAAQSAVLDELIRVTRLRTEVSLDELRKDDYALFVMVIGATDRAHHDWWKHIDPTHPAYDPAEAERYGDYILRVYQCADECIGQFLASADEDTTVIIMSDHGGMAHPRSYFNTNAWLATLGLLAPVGRNERPQRALMSMVKRQYKARVRSLPYLERVYRKLPARLKRFATEFDSRAMMNTDAVDWSQTRAYRFPMYPPVEGVEINVIGRQPSGCVQPGDEYEALRTRILEEARSLRDPQTGEPVVVEAYRREELYSGEYIETAPDLILVTRDCYKGGTGLDRLVDPVPLEVLAKLSGVHRMDGILVAQGPRVRSHTTLEGARIIDVAPTILTLLDMDVPSEMDGKVLTDLCDVPARAEATPRPAESPVPVPVPADTSAENEDLLYGYTPEEEESVRVKLEALGYL